MQVLASAPSPSFFNFLTLARACALLVMALGACALIAWTFQINYLDRVVPGWVGMKANGAVCFLLSGLSLALSAPEALPAGRRRTAQGLALVSIAISLLTLAEYLLDLDLGLDQWLFIDRGPFPWGHHPGRMPPYVAAGFVATGSALLCLTRARATAAVQGLALLIGLLGVAGAQVYLTDLPLPVPGNLRFGMPLHSALAFMLLATGLLAARARQGLVPPALARLRRILGGRPGLVLFPAALAATLALGATALWNNRRLVEAADRRDATQDQLIRLEDLANDVWQAESAAWGYAQTGQTAYLRDLDRALAHYDVGLADLRTLTGSDPDLRRRTEDLGLAIARKARHMRAQLLSRAGAPADGTDVPVEAKRLTERIVALLRDMVQDEQRLLSERDGELKLRTRQAAGALALGIPLSALVLLAVFLALWWEAGLRQSAQKALLARTWELESANEELKAFSYSVAHDLRAPLRNIDGYCRILLEDQGERLDRDGRHALDRLMAVTRHMSDLIEDLLALSRLSRQEMKVETVDLSALARDCLAQLQAREPGRRAHLKVERGLQARGDPALLRAVLENLLDNAWKFSARREEVRVEVGSDGLKDGRRVFFVRDHGAGFDMAYRDKLFGVFQRLHSTAEFPGNGVGLAIVQRVLRRHGGEVWAEGAVGSGAAFYFTL